MNGKDKESLISKQERAVKQQEILEKKRRLRAEYNLAAEKPGKKFLEWKGKKKEREPRIFAQRTEVLPEPASSPDSDMASDSITVPDSDRGPEEFSDTVIDGNANGMLQKTSSMVSNRVSDAVSSTQPQDRVSASQWFLSICWLKIPVIGILYALILALNPKAPYEKRNFARGYLVYRVMVWGLSLTILYVVYQVGLGFVDELLSYVK